MSSIRKIASLLLVAAFILPGCTYHQEIVKLPDMSLYNRTIIFNSVQYVPLLRFCDYYDLDWDWDLVSQRIEIKKGNNSFVVRPDSDLALINNKPITLDYPIEYKDGAAYIPAKTALLISEDVFGIKEVPILVKKWHQIETVVIDPGHGGKDPGAVNRYGAKEKNIVLDISKRLKSYLEKKGFKVILTRDKDVFIPLQKRSELANKKDADLFISIHANASKYSRAKGFEVYYLSEATDDNARALAASENASLKFENDGSPTMWDLVLTENRRESRGLAYYICNITSDSLGMRKRGVKGARFVVLKGAMMPAVLVEVGFLTNRREGAKLAEGYHREKIAKAIGRSVLAYKREFERTNGFTN